MYQEYLNEIKYLKWYIISISVVILASFSIYFFLSDAVIMDLGKEDHFFEWLTFICFLSASVFFLVSYKKKKYFFLILAGILFFGAGEEISWGQRIFNFKTTERLKKLNVQNEFNIHNIEIFNSEKFDGTVPKGWARITEINFMFKIFCILFGVLLPILAYHLTFINKMLRSFMLPIPPISIGIFFIISIGIRHLFLEFLPKGKSDYAYYHTVTEIYEFLASYIFLIISIYFFNKRNSDILGLDIKQYI